MKKYWNEKEKRTMTAEEKAEFDKKMQEHDEISAEEETVSAETSVEPESEKDNADISMADEEAKTKKSRKK